MAEDVQDVLFVTSLVFLYAATFLSFAVAGNLIVGRKPSKTEDILYPFTRDFRNHFGTRDLPIFIYFLYYIIFFVFLSLISSQIMSLRGSFRSWVNKLMGAEETSARDVSPTTSHTSVSSQEATGSKTDSGSDTAIAKSSKSKKKKAAKKKQDPKAIKVPSVMRSSVVDPRNQIIPPLPRLSMKEDTNEKLSRVLLKFDSMDFSDEQQDIKTPPKTPPGKKKL